APLMPPNDESLSLDAPPNTRLSPRGSVSVIVPTYKEVENLPLLTERLEEVREKHDLSLALLIMDDDSQDGTQELVSSMDRDWLTLVVRKEERGLSRAVLEGLRLARGDVLVVMDADLSHPPEKIPEMLVALEKGADLVMGSRYTTGGLTEAYWGFFRRLNSRIATLFARPFTSVKDPMSGFFALPRKTFESARDLNPIGYKMGLELMVKCNLQRIEEIPIHFKDRQFGQSKLTLTEQKKYLQHLCRLFIYKYWRPFWE
ncbi:MAG: polyprenol monophosphomannose synthase, partial [Acidobacteria bacterium]